jgi:hypothetical protein
MSTNSIPPNNPNSTSGGNYFLQTPELNTNTVLTVNSPEITIINSSSPITVTLPPLSIAGGKRFFFHNDGSATATIIQDPSDISVNIFTAGQLLPSGANMDVFGINESNDPGDNYWQSSSPPFQVGSIGNYGVVVSNKSSLAVVGGSNSFVQRPLVSNGTSSPPSFSNSMTLAQQIFNPLTPPATPATSGAWILYVDSTDGNKLKAKASTGTIVILGTP